MLSLTVACQVVVYQGLAAVPLHFLFGRFKKSFFLHPTTYELYGRVGVRPRLATVAFLSVTVCLLHAWASCFLPCKCVMRHALLPYCVH